MIPFPGSKFLIPYSLFLFPIRKVQFEAPAGGGARPSHHQPTVLHAHGYKGLGREPFRRSDPEPPAGLLDHLEKRFGRSTAGDFVLKRHHHRLGERALLTDPTPVFGFGELFDGASLGQQSIERLVESERGLDDVVGEVVQRPEAFRQARPRLGAVGPDAMQRVGFVFAFGETDLHGTVRFESEGEIRVRSVLRGVQIIQNP